MINKYLKLYSILLSILGISTFCNPNSDRIQPDISTIADPQPTLRLEQELYKIPEGKTDKGLKSLEKLYPDLMPFYYYVVMNISDTQRAHVINVLDEFIHHPVMVELNDTIQLAFKDFDKYEKELFLMLKNYQYYFPEQPAPQLLTYTSQFGPKGFKFNSYLGIGLDLYLGVNYKYYASMEFPNYFVKRLQPKYLATDAAFNLIQDLREEPLERGASLLDMMVHYGKIYYIASLLLPKKDLKDFFYYTEEDWTWCEDNEKEIWSFFIDGEWLYANQYIKYSKFIEDAPTTMGMPQGAPDRVGRWVGYQIVKRFMERIPEVTPADLINITSGQEVLVQSKYKPYR